MINRPLNPEHQNLAHVAGIFDSHTNMNRALAELEQLELSENISMLMSEETRHHYEDVWGEVPQGIEGFEHTTKMPEGAAAGGLTGGVLGAIIGGLTLVGSIILPGSGLLVAGPLVGVLTGGAIGVATGGLLGALVGLGITETEAKFYHESLQKRGNILLVAHVNLSLVDTVTNIFKRCGAQSVKVT